MPSIILQAQSFCACTKTHFSVNAYNWNGMKNVIVTKILIFHYNWDVFVIFLFYFENVNQPI